MKRSKCKKVLIVGWGFIGSAIGRALDEMDHTVYSLSRECPTSGLNPNQDFRKCEFTSIGQLKTWLPEIDHIVYAAGGLLPPSAAADPEKDVIEMVGPLIRLLEVVKDRPSIGFTFISSGGAVYGDCGPIAIPETYKPNPRSAYGTSRLVAEQYVNLYSKSFGIPIQILRLSNVYGPGQKYNQSHGVIPTLIHHVSSNLPITIYGEGDEVRDYLFIDDVGLAVAELLQSSENLGIVNLGTGIGTSIKELVEIIFSITDRCVPVLEAPRRWYEVKSNLLDVARVRSMINFNPIGLKEGISLTISASNETAVCK